MQVKEILRKNMCTMQHTVKRESEKQAPQDLR